MRHAYSVGKQRKMASATIDEPQFWHAIAILISNYHVINKKIFQVVITQVEKQSADGTWCESNEAELDRSLQQQESGASGLYKISFKFLTKKADNILATGTVDFGQRSYQCNFVSHTVDDFLVRLNKGQLEITTLSERLDATQNKRWAQFVLQPRLLSWAQSQPNCEAPKVKSLHLVDAEMYNDRYKALKQKHATRLLQYWQAAQESTDPLKFIYEDLAIAAYLITLWSCTQTEPTGFADLGCGNGLLVHILNVEGYKGYGYDIRKRKLWSHYEADIKLIEHTVDPHSFCVPADVDWLIGNHSDELSPWLPVLAARLKIKYFLLPCCPFELSGVKFQRRNTNISAYQDFYQYTCGLSQKCGFETLQDRLKIPSTKRLALIGLKRSPRAQNFEAVVQTELEKYKICHMNNEAAVKLRDKVEQVRNCTQVEKSLIDALVLKIFQMLLGESAATDDVWQPGQRLSMRDIAQALTKEELRSIKSECGGIKTLLRNKHEVFEFCGNDQIGIRKPVVSAKLLARKGHTIKKRLCFFKQHHPQGCPLGDSDCSFIH